MVNNNKILTVSYGTFSCTLEGFEDSFGTMKAIAEYFRDLAADDRYFGAEPPQPDADMLARIAQREVSRQVEARKDASGNGIVLRASEYQAPAVAATAAVAADVAEPAVPTKVEEQASEDLKEVAAEPTPVDTSPAAEETAQDGPNVSAPTIQEPAPKPWPDAPEATETPDVAASADGDSIAAKLQRIRAVVSKNEVEKTSDFTEDQHADVFVSDTVHELSQAIAEDDAAMTAPVEEAKDLSGDDLDSVLGRYDAEPEDGMGVMERLETVDTAGDADGSYDENYDDTDTDETGDVLSVLNAIQQEPEGPFGTADSADADSDGDEQIAETAFAEDLAQTDSNDFSTDADDQTDGVGEVEDAANEPFVAADQASEEPVGEEVTATPEDAVDLSQFIADDEAADQQEAAVAEEGLFFDLDDDAEEEAVPVNEVSNILDDAEPEASADDAPEMPVIKTSLSEEDEADLMRQLAAVHDDEAPAEDEVVSEEPAPAVEVAPEQVDDSVVSEAQPGSENTDEDVSRLMAEAEEKMGTPESSTNRETYSQLRAAVAAAEAERSAGNEVDDNASDDPYREDLASVVRPRRPVAGETQRPGRPASDGRPAPLKLVAEQRIDIDGAQQARGPIRPRRVSAEDEGSMTVPEGQEQEGGFAEYAAERGATELPELLEAAASYLSFVEGKNQFSRPQLMKKVRQIETHEFNREDGLRSFGQLLRDGKIEKTGGGRFTASGDIGFRPDQREAG